MKNVNFTANPTQKEILYLIILLSIMNVWMKNQLYSDYSQKLTEARRV